MSDVQDILIKVEPEKLEALAGRVNSKIKAIRGRFERTLPRAGRLTPILDTDWQCFGGQTEKPKRLVGKACEGKLKLTLAPFSGRLYKLV